MKKKINQRIILRCVMMATAICIALCISSFFEYRDSTFQTYNDFGYQIGEVAMSYVEGDTIADYIDTGVTDEKYDYMADSIYNLYSRADISSIYICIPNPDEMTLTNIYDVRIHEAAKPEEYALGVVDPIGGTLDEVVKVYQTGKKSDDYFIRDTDFGYNTSAILPVTDKANNVTALLVVDIPVRRIEKNIANFLLSNLIITVVVVAVFITGLQMMIKKSIVKPLKTISEETSKFTQSEKLLSEKLGKIKTHDEIETLAESILKMEADINKYIENITAITAEKERIGAELNVATRIQASMLPCIFPPYPHRKEFDIYATMTPAKEVGGDFYDFFLIDDDHFALVMADVSGKGVPAALFMVIAKTLIKNMSQLGNGTVDEILHTVNRLLCENNEEDMFVTVWLGIVELSTGKLSAANAGHEFPVIKRKGGNYELFKDKHGFVLAAMPDSKYTPYEIQLEKGDILYLYTDGVPEATNEKYELFDTERLLETLNENKNVDLQKLLVNVKKRIDEFVGEAPQFDDITMLVFKYKGTDSTEE